MRACSYIYQGCGFPTNDVEALQWQVYCLPCISGTVTKTPSRVPTKLLFQYDVGHVSESGGFGVS